jgi:hypothetical protein
MDGPGPEEFDVTHKMQKMPREDKSIPSICSRCGKIYKINTWLIDEGKKIGVSHGYCEECFEKVRTELEGAAPVAHRQPPAAAKDKLKAEGQVKTLYMRRKKKGATLRWGK